MNSENVDPDFECRIDVYAHKMEVRNATASTPQKIRRKFTDISLSVGRRLSGVVSMLCSQAVDSFNVVLATALMAASS